MTETKCLHCCGSGGERTSEKLKCCPFCGSDEVVVSRTNPFACWIECAKCGAPAESDKTREGAFANWNRRVDTEGAFAKIVDDDDEEVLSHYADVLPHWTSR